MNTTTRSSLIVDNLQDKDVSGANLAGADLVRADLRNKNLAGINLEDTDLEGANLDGCANSEPTIRLGNSPLFLEDCIRS